jgi:hypothetical protein
MAKTSSPGPGWGTGEGVVTEAREADREWLVLLAFRAAWASEAELSEEMVIVKVRMKQPRSVVLHEVFSTGMRTFNLVATWFQAPFEWPTVMGRRSFSSRSTLMLVSGMTKLGGSDGRLCM